MIFENEPELRRFDIVAAHANALVRRNTPPELIAQWQAANIAGDLDKWGSLIVTGAEAMLSGDNYPPCEVKEP